MILNRVIVRASLSFAAVCGVLGTSGCASAGSEQQSILDPAGPRAASIHGLWEWMFGIGAAVWVIVVAVMVAALVRRRRSDEGDTTSARAERQRSAAVRGRPVRIVAVAGALVPGIIIAVVLTMTTIVQRQIDDASVAEAPVVEVIGHQYWWEVRYPDDEVISANEVHIPVGERVRFEVSSRDVIHSFWVPELGGKIDMIPGRSNTIWLAADEPGTYWGQCAEYCGAQHARMRLVIVAHEPAEYDGWILSQQQEAVVPQPTSEEDTADPVAARGREVFLSSSCVYCHTVAGTAAAGEVGPDLTHLASRETLAAGTIPNDLDNLAAWILDPQSIKPGNLMPATEYEDPDDLAALLAYLTSLE